MTGEDSIFKEAFKHYKLPTLPIIHRLLMVIIFLLGVICLGLGIHLENYEILSRIFDLAGSFLVIAIPLEILREFFFEDISQESFINKVSKLFDDKIDAELIQKSIVLKVSELFDDKIDAELMQAKKFGLGRIEDSLPITKIFDELQAGDTLWWLDTFCPAHKQWIESVQKAVEKGALINMLILNPKSAFCELREKEIGDRFKGGSFTAELNLFIQDFKQCRDDLTSQTGVLGHLELVAYNDLLGVPCYIVTRNEKPIYAYSSMYLKKATGIGFPHFYWKEGPMCEHLYKYVKEKYEENKAKELDF